MYKVMYAFIDVGTDAYVHMHTCSWGKEKKRPGICVKGKKKVPIYVNAKRFVLLEK